VKDPSEISFFIYPYEATQVKIGTAMELFWTGPPRGVDVNFTLDALKIKTGATVNYDDPDTYTSGIKQEKFPQRCSYVEVSVSSDSSTSSSVTNDCTFSAKLNLSTAVVSVGERIVMRLQWTVGTADDDSH
jgi:hypothetical protein